MPALSKVCDAADWFDPEVLLVIRNELQETPRFHRKQWEFAMIFLALKKYGFLHPDAFGLSLGGGKERVLYSIARHIQHLTVTDLYELDTPWDCAKTDDPDEFIKSHKPFEVEDPRLKALRMDMRELEFEDNHFDFCYSSCAIEHIGDYEDFLRHLNEVQRVLKEGGIYVFTTELHFGNETIKDPNNYIFSPAYLRDLIAASSLTPAQQPNVSLAAHCANFPLPSNIKHLTFSGKNHLGNTLLQEYPHLILLRGKHPFTSISLILHKNSKTNEKAPLTFQGLEESRRFLEVGLSEYRRLLQTLELHIYPFSALPAGVSRYFLDHADFFSRPEDAIPADDTIFHSDYAWLGAGPRNFRVRLQATDLPPYQSCTLQLRIHRYTTLASRNIECVAEENLTITGGGSVWKEMSITTDENSCYAVLGKIVGGTCRFNEIEIRSNARNPLPAQEFLPEVAEKGMWAKSTQNLRLKIKEKLKIGLSFILRKRERRITARNSGVATKILNFLFRLMRIILKIINTPKSIYVGDNLIMSRVLRYKMLLPAKDLSMMPSLLSDGSWEPMITKLFSGLISGGMTFLDVGGAFGYYTLIAADKVGSSGRVITFEPEPYNYRLIQKNCFLNGYQDRVTIINRAASDKVGKAKLYYKEDYVFGAPSLIGLPQEKTLDIETVSIDSFLKQRQNAKVDVVKIDVEGYEPFVIRGMTETIKSNPDIKIIMEFSPGYYRSINIQPLDFIQELKTLDFSIIKKINEYNGQLEDISSNDIDSDRLFMCYLSK